MTDTPRLYCLTYQQLRTLLLSAAAGDSIPDAMLTAQDHHTHNQQHKSDSPDITKEADDG